MRCQGPLRAGRVPHLLIEGLHCLDRGRPRRRGRIGQQPIPATSLPKLDPRRQMLNVQISARLAFPLCFFSERGLRVVCFRYSFTCWPGESCKLTRANLAFSSPALGPGHD